MSTPVASCRCVKYSNMRHTETETCQLYKLSPYGAPGPQPVIMNGVAFSNTDRKSISSRKIKFSYTSLFKIFKDRRFDLDEVARGVALDLLRHFVPRNDRR
jgi:hypothetical protein